MVERRRGAGLAQVALYGLRILGPAFQTTPIPPSPIFSIRR